MNDYSENNIEKSSVLGAAVQDYLSKGYHITAWSRTTGKGPFVKGWDKKSVTHATDQQNIGLIHGLSWTFCLDVDDEPFTRKALAIFGINLDKLITEYPRYYGGSPYRPKLIMRLPAQAKAGLGVKKLLYAYEGHPDYQKGEIFSLRGATPDARNGKITGVQDVLVPSIHPGTKEPYKWYPGELGLPPIEELPFMPWDLLAVWEKWDKAEKMIKEHFGWVEMKPELQKRTASPGTYQGESIIDQFNQQHTPLEILPRHGYIVKGKKLLSPNSSSGAPGVSIFYDENGKQLAYSNHGSDAWSDGHAWDAFALYAHFEHGGNYSLATTALRSAA